MPLLRRSALIYGLLLFVWLVVVGWQVEEHFRVQEAAKADLRNSSKEIANTLSVVVRGMSFRGGVLQQRLEPVLEELVNGQTNQLVKSSKVLSVVLLNTASEPVVSAGNPIDFSHTELLQNGEHWGVHTVTFVHPIEGAKVTPEEGRNAHATVVIPPPPPGFTNGPHGAGRDFPRREPPPEDGRQPLPSDASLTNHPAGHDPNEMVRGGSDVPPPGPPPEGESRPRGNREGGPRPPWLRGMDEKDYQALIQKHELHGLVLAMSTEKYLAISHDDLWLRYVIVFFAGISALGVGLARRSLAKTSELQIRLIRASELNSHLREMNLAAAGLAHETRNPLNIIRGMAQMLSKAVDSTPDIHEKSLAIVNQTDKVTAQLNEFINYSRPREVRRVRLSLPSAVTEVVRTLGFDIEEKKLTIESTGDPVFIEADEQLLRQLLFNLLMNAVQAVGAHGHIQVVTRKAGATEAVLEIRDDGPGVPPENRQEIFKPYFTTNQKGTGLGLAVVQQIVLAHGWEITCLPNEPKGAVFRISHLKLKA
jgi:signal transduction histidine kinase